MIGTRRKRLFIALLFLLPNLAGFLLFTAGPVLFSLWMSFTDFQLTKHNQYSVEEISYVGFDNYARLLWGDESVFFWDYFWNTVFLMIGIPISIFGSLALALMLNAKASPEKPKSRWVLASAAAAVSVVMCLGAWILAAPNPQLADVMSTETGLTDLTAFEVQELRRNGLVLFLGLVGVVVTAGLAIGQMFFRAAFYLPTLLAGVAMFLLWKTLYRPRGGLINAVLQPLLDGLETFVLATPAVLWYGLGILTAIAGVGLLIKLTLTGVEKLRGGDAGPASFGARLTFAATIAATLVGLGYVGVQLPERSLLPSGHAGLTPEQVTATLDAFESQLAGEYDDLEYQTVRAGFMQGPEPDDLSLRLARLQEPQLAASVQRFMNTFLGEDADASAVAPPDVVDEIAAAAADRFDAPVPPMSLLELAAEDDQPGPATFEQLTQRLTATVLQEHLSEVSAVVDRFAPEDGSPLSKAQAASAMDAYAERFDAEAYDAAAYADLYETVVLVPHRDVLSQLISIAGEENAGAVTTIVRAESEWEHRGYVSGAGLTAPEWLLSSDWAKTALIVMGVWLAIGGANMLLYLAGLSNIPPELYEAAAIDGATGWQRFVHVTWPQLAPTTFFIVIMSTIGGLQGGFEQALVMTEGKADTIVLTYYLYNLAFNGNFQLGLASAVAWIMFAIIFAMTAFNFRFGSRMTNE